MKKGQWCEASFGDLFEISSSKRVHQKDWKPAGVPFYRAREVVKLAKNGFVENELFISEELFMEFHEKYGVPKAGDLMVSAVGTLGACYVVKSSDRFYYKDASVLRFCPKQKLCSDFFKHAFLTSGILDQVHAGSGSTVGTYTIQRANATRIFVPPLPEQRRIAAILDQAEALRTKRRAALAKLDTLTQSIFIEMFGDTVSNPKKWPISALGPLMVNGPQNGLYKPSELYGEGTPILRIDGFYAGAVTDMARLKRVKLSPQEVETYGLRANDLVVNRVNSPEYLGKCALIPELTEPTVFESNMMRFAIDEERVHSRYIISALQGASIRAQILGRAKHAINQSSINQKDVEGFVIQIPPIQYQHQFAERTMGVEKLTTSQQWHLLKLDSLFSTLQYHAFRGEL